MKNEMTRYSVIRDKNPREIVLLRGGGCKWRRCAFCDYHLDFSLNAEENFALNKKILKNVSGIYSRLEVINSGSFCDLDEDTFKEIEKVCKEKGISVLHFECHYKDRNAIPELRSRFNALGISVKIKIGVETFDFDFREEVLLKGIEDRDPEIISKDFNEVCLLFGLSGQTVKSMKNDIETGLRYFERVCVNIMTPNTTKIRPDENVINTFVNELYPLYKDDERVDILLNNTDFGVGGKENA